MGGDSGSSDSGGGFGPRQDFDPGLGVPSEAVIESIMAGAPDPYTVQYDTQSSGAAPTNVIRGGSIFTPGLYGSFPTAIPQAQPVGRTSTIDRFTTASANDPWKMSVGSMAGNALANIFLGGLPFLGQQLAGQVMSVLGGRMSTALGVPNMLELSGSPLKGEVMAGSPMFDIEPRTLFDDTDPREDLMEEIADLEEEDQGNLDEEENIVSSEKQIMERIQRARRDTVSSLLRKEGTR